MQLVTYESAGRSDAGLLIDGRVVHAVAAAAAAGIPVDPYRTTTRAIIQWPSDAQSRLQAAAQDMAGRNHPQVYLLQDVVLGPPIPDPEKIICLGLNYRSHAEEAGFTPPEIPILFAKYRNSLAGPTSPIVLPGLDDQVDYEGELAVVIRKRCKNISPGQALEHVAGYMAMNDVSARDLQFRTGQWLSGKALDTFAPCGPALVMDEITDPQDLDILTRVNGQVLQHGNTRNMIFSVAETVSYISKLMTLEPGDIISTGTPEGVGFKRNPPIFLHHGDQVEVEIQGIGRLSNPVSRNPSSMGLDTGQ